MKQRCAPAARPRKLSLAWPPWHRWSVDVLFNRASQVRLNPVDATSRHLLGLWFYEVAGLSWATRRVAAALFAAPPTVRGTLPKLCAAAHTALRTLGRAVRVAHQSRALPVRAGHF